MKSVTPDSIQRVLCLGAHSDDIEIGCGGTILRMTEQNPQLDITWVVFSAEGEREAEARNSARAFLTNAGRAGVVVQDFRGSYFPYQADRIKEFFETLKDVRPDLVFTHYREDRHQDHRVVSDLTWNTFRSHIILEYEIPKYDGDLGSPNVFVPLTRQHLDQKTTLLLDGFPSQAGKHWFTAELFCALPRIRGMECDSPTQYAEAFYARKLLFS